MSANMNAAVGGAGAPAAVTQKRNNLNNTESEHPRSMTSYPSPQRCRCAPQGCVRRDSGRAWLLVGKVKDASLGEVWSAVEVKREGPDQPYVELYDENKRTCRVTVKRMPKKEIDEKKGKMREDPMNEIAALDILSDRGLRHVLQKVAALEDDETVYLLMPAIGGGCQGWDTTSLEEMETVRKLFLQVVKGMKYVHSKGICHSKMCLENVLFDESRENAYITNFGFSFRMPVDDENRRKAESSYCSPETFKGQAYDGVKMDVFAAGAMLFTMLTGRPPFTTASSLDKDFKSLVCKGKVAEAIGRHQLKLIPGGEEAVALLKGMMALKPKDRFSPDQVLEHPWMARGI